MTRVVLCIAEDHEPLLICLAVLICLIGSFLVFRLLRRINTASGRGQLGWIALSSVALGAMTWSTHFVAMMGYRPHAPVVLDPILTMVSLLIAIAASALGLAVIVSLRRAGPPLGGAIIGLSVSALHYVGIAAYHIDGLVTWDWSYVCASVGLSIGLSALAFSLYSNGRGKERPVTAAIMLSVAVATLHFTGMAAFKVEPLGFGTSAGLSALSLTSLAIATALSGLLVVGCVAVSLVIDEHMREEAYQHLRDMALRDSLTNLPNRANYDETLNRLLADPKHAGLAIVMIDLSNFKMINDTYGHFAGDELLIALGMRFKNALQPDEFLARLGGDEFAAILPTDKPGDVRTRLARIRGVFKDPFCFQRFTTQASASIGVALSPTNGEDLDTLLANADLAMYRAKAARSVEPCFYQQAMDQSVREHRDLATRLRATIGTSAFYIEYQVQASLLTQEITGYEALCRWQGDDHKPISPAIFIPLAEEIGEIARLGTWVLETACREAAGWAQPYSIAVNLSPVQVTDPSLIETVTRVLRETGLDPARLELELTESAIIGDRDLAANQFFALRKLGVRLALDDFGAGYSSLDVLRSFPFDRIKLDASFMSNIVGDPQAISILNAITFLGRKLDTPILAEGIETFEQLAIATGEGCMSMQGYLIGRPSRHLAEPATIRRSMAHPSIVPDRCGGVLAPAFAPAV